MKKGTIAVLIAAVFATVACFGAVAMAEKTKSGEVADTFKIDNTATLGKLKKPPVEFTHKAHVEKHKVACNDCHHTYKAGKNTWKEGDKVHKCSECHKAKDTTMDGAKAFKIQNAFHKNCQACHKKVKKGPTKCTECHKK